MPSVRGLVRLRCYAPAACLGRRWVGAAIGAIIQHFGRERKGATEGRRVGRPAGELLAAPAPHHRAEGPSSAPSPGDHGKFGTDCVAAQ